MFSCTTAHKLSIWCLLKWNSAGCLELCVCIDRHIKELHPSKNCRWQQTHCHNFTALRTTHLNFRQATARRRTLLVRYVRIRWRNSQTWRDQTCRVTHALQHTSTRLWRNTPAAGSFLCHLLPRSHSHWAMPYAVTQTPLVLSQTIVNGHLPTCPEVSGWNDVRPLAVGASLVALGWTTMTAVVMVIRNATKITDCHTVQTEGRLKYSQCQVPKCVDVCQFHIILL